MTTRRHMMGLAAAAVSVATAVTRAGDGVRSLLTGHSNGRGGASDPTSALQGKLFFKGDDRYEAYRLAAVWNARKPDRYPNAIVMADSVEDVSAAVRLAKSRGWRVGVRSGGHSWVAPHLRDGALLINLSRMKELSVNAEARTAIVSPGWQGQAFNKILREQHDLMFPTGHCYGIGLGGFILAGGHGWNSRLWGPACAHLEALDLIDANGELVHASASENADYYWAARGAGPGFPGVAVRFYLRLHPRPHGMKASRYAFPIDTLDDMLAWYGSMVKQFPRYLEASLRGQLLDGQSVVCVSGTALANSDDEADAALALFESAPAITRALVRDYCLPVVVPGDAESPSTLSPTGARYVTDGAWSNATTPEIAHRIRPFLRDFPSKQSWYLWMTWGEPQTLPDMAYSLQGHSYLSPNAVWYDPNDDEACANWAERSIDAVRDISVGGQMNDDNMAVNRLPYLSASAAARLRRIQRRRDPDRRFVGFLTA